MLTISTVNVNGIRAATRKGFTTWLTTTDADIVCLQEVRAEQEQIPKEILTATGWHMRFAPSTDKGRSGVAILSRTPALSYQIGFASTEFDTAGRYLEAHFPTMTVASLYLPSGEANTPKQEQKERFMTEFANYLTHARHREETAGRDLIIGGDWNIAHQTIDLKNWKNNHKNAGFLPHERQWLTTILNNGFTDIQRHVQPEGPGPYSWWSYRGRAFDNDAGWRIDYLMATTALAQRCVKATVERAPSHDQRWSDHAPVTATFMP